MVRALKSREWYRTLNRSGRGSRACNHEAMRAAGKRPGSDS